MGIVVVGHAWAYCNQVPVRHRAPSAAVVAWDGRSVDASHSHSDFDIGAVPAGRVGRAAYPFVGGIPVADRGVGPVPVVDRGVAPGGVGPHTGPEPGLVVVCCEVPVR